MRGGVRVAAHDRHARLRQAELGADHVHDAVAAVAERVEAHAELGAVAVERLELGLAELVRLARCRWRRCGRRSRPCGRAGAPCARPHAGPRTPAGSSPRAPGAGRRRAGRRRSHGRPRPSRRGCAEPLPWSGKCTQRLSAASAVPYTGNCDLCRMRDGKLCRQALLPGLWRVARRGVPDVRRRHRPRRPLLRRVRHARWGPRRWLRALRRPAPWPRVARAEPATERRLVTVLFADLVGFTTLSETRDSEQVRALLSRYFDVCRRLIELYGGVVEKFIGDAVMAVWGAHSATEDDPERAVRAALDLVAAVTALGDEIGVPDLRGARGGAHRRGDGHDRRRGRGHGRGRRREHRLARAGAGRGGPRARGRLDAARDRADRGVRGRRRARAEGQDRPAPAVAGGAHRVGRARVAEVGGPGGAVRRPRP